MRLLCALLIAASAFADSNNQVFSDFTTPLPLTRDETLVIGIVGGWERWDAPPRAIRRTALKLRSRQLGGVWVETIENQKLGLAQELARKPFDFDGSGVLYAAEIQGARIILYDQRLGGRATLRLFRLVERTGHKRKPRDRD